MPNLTSLLHFHTIFSLASMKMEEVESSSKGR